MDCTCHRTKGSADGTRLPIKDSSGNVVNAGRGPARHINDVWWRLRTGDIVLFSSKHAASNITKLFTYSQWDHVALIVRPRDAGGKVYAVEWCGGLIASELVERLEEYNEYDAREICVRQLLLPFIPGQSKRERLTDRLILESRIESFVAALFERSLGSNHMVPFNQVLKAARKTLIGFGSSVSQTKAVYVDDLQTLFCSKTIAVVYKAVGILAPNRKSADFLPKHYAASKDKWLDLQHGSRLGPETPLQFGAQGPLAAIGHFLGGAGLTGGLANALAALHLKGATFDAPDPNREIKPGDAFLQRK